MPPKLKGWKEWQKSWEVENIDNCLRLVKSCRLLFTNVGNCYVHIWYFMFLLINLWMGISAVSSLDGFVCTSCLELAHWSASRNEIFILQLETVANYSWVIITAHFFSFRRDVFKWIDCHHIKFIFSFLKNWPYRLR